MLWVSFLELTAIETRVTTAETKCKGIEGGMADMENKLDNLTKNQKDDEAKRQEQHMNLKREIDSKIDGIRQERSKTASGEKNLFVILIIL